jgi:hypothetical protein|tara:strand:- start:5538 stop:5960 length:423 start_codon:yes stop_codon:yes gene_type:complete
MEEFKGDKRTKAYKEWKAKFDKQNSSKSKGLGDTVAKITKATGIKKVVKFIAGEDCGCDERQEKLNKVFKYRNVECLTEDEFSTLAKYFDANLTIYDKYAQKELLPIAQRIFGIKITGCTSCAFKGKVLKPLMSVYSTYK